MHRSTTRARHGDYKVICDRTGFTYWRSECVKQWDGLIVHRSHAEKRHPQELIRPRRETFGVPDARLDRSIANSNFTGPLTTEIAAAAGVSTYAFFGAMGQLALGQHDDGIDTNAAGNTGISVDSTSGFSAGDRILITLDSGDTHMTTVARIDSASVLAINDALPGPVSVGNRVINYSASL